MRVGIAELLPSTVTRNVMTEAELLGFGFLGRFRSLGLFGALHLGLQLGQRRDVAEGRLFDRSVDLLHRVLGCVVCLAALGAFGGTLGYGYILNAPKNTILPASFIGLAGYIVYILLGMAGFGTMSAYFFSTVFVSVVCELLARKMRTPSTIFLLGALVPLVPGYNFYLAMLALVENRGAAAAQEGMVAVQIVAAIAVGAAVTSVLFRALAEKNKKLL